MPGSLTLTRAKDPRKKEGKRISCGAAGYWAHVLETQISMQGQNAENADLPHTYVLNLKKEFSYKPFSIYCHDDYTIHVLLDGHQFRGACDTNADRRMNAAAITLEAADNKDEILRNLDLSAHELRILTLAKSRETNPLQFIKDIANLTGIFGKEAKRGARNNLKGMEWLRENTEYHENACDYHAHGYYKTWKPIIPECDAARLEFQTTQLKLQLNNS